MRIERKEVGGKITIDFFSDDDLKTILDIVNSKGVRSVASTSVDLASAAAATPEVVVVVNEEAPLDDRSKEEIEAHENEEELYSLKNFSI